MNNLEYLNHISQDNRPLTPTKKSKLNLGLIIRVLVVSFVVIILLGGIMGLVNNLSKHNTEVTKQLSARINSVSNIISTYSRNIKSSQLRAINVSLSATLTNTSRELTAYLKAHATKDQKNPLTPSADFMAKEAELFTGEKGIDAQLHTAKLNGVLDRNYAPIIHAQVSLLLAMTGDLLERDEDPALQKICEDFYSNLNTINQALDNFISK